MQPRPTLSPIQLTAFMLVLIFGPIGCGLLLSFYTRKIPEPKLHALVRIDTTWIKPNSGSDPRLVPCVSIKNPTNEAWKNLSVGLNEQFYCGEPKGIGPGEIVSLPLEAFVSRNGSVRFPVGNRDIQLITVFGQIPSGARAVSEHEMPTNRVFRPSKENADDGWVDSLRR